MKDTKEPSPCIPVALNLKGKTYDPKVMAIKFTRNLPANLLEQSEIVANLKDVLDIIPLDELFAQLSFIENPQVAAAEAKRTTSLPLAS